MAILDVALGDDKVYEVADTLIGQGVPILFVTGYDRSDLPIRYADVPMFRKPAGVDEVITALGRILAK